MRFVIRIVLSLGFLLSLTASIFFEKFGDSGGSFGMGSLAALITVVLLIVHFND